MAKFNYEVTLPNGERYLTTTLAEAKALQARGSKYPHGKPNRGALVQNSSAPMSRKDRMKPALNDGYKKPSQAWVREILQNSFDNFADKVVLEFGDNDALAIDNGSGMDRNLLLNKFLVPGMSAKPTGSVGGFGEAKKLLTFPWDYFAVITLVKGGKVQVALGVGNRWDYWEEGKCYDVEYDEEDEPKAISITPTTPNPKYLPYKEIEGIVKRVKKQGNGTALYIRGTDSLTSYLASLDSSKVLSGNKGLPSPADAIGYVAYCELPDKEIVIDGKSYYPNVQIPANAEKMPQSRVYSGLELYYVQPDTVAKDLSGMTIVRAKSRRGTQVMWTEVGVTSGTLFVEITGDTKWLLNNTRDSFEYYPEQWWQKFKVEFAKDVGSMFLDFKMDDEFEGNKQVSSADWSLLSDKMWQNRMKANDARRAFENAARGGESKKEAAKEIAKEVEKEIEQGEEGQRTPSENTKDMLEDAAKGTAADVQGVVELALWNPPLRVMSNFVNWRVPDRYLPKTMGGKEIRLLRAWTEAIRRVLALIGHYEHQFAIGFIFSKEVVALTTGSRKLAGVVCYLINPFVSASELRSENLFIPPKKVSLVPDAPNTIDLDVSNEQHLSVLVSRAVHELVHGVYGICGHDEDFSSAITSLVAQVGDEYHKIIKAARAGAKMPLPKIKGAPFKTDTTPSGRRTPQRVERVAGVDPRLPPTGTVLQKGDLTVLIGENGEILVISTQHGKGFGVAKSISQAVEQHLSAVSGKPRSASGYVFFDLEPNKRSKYIKGTLSHLGVMTVEDDIRNDYIPRQMYYYDGWRDAY